MNTNAPEAFMPRSMPAMPTQLASDITVDLLFSAPASAGLPATWFIDNGRVTVSEYPQKIIYALDPMSSSGWYYQQAWLIAPNGSVFQSYALSQNYPIKFTEANIDVNVFDGTTLKITVTNTNYSGSEIKLGLLFLVGDKTQSFISPDPQIILPPQQNNRERAILHPLQAAKR